MKKVEVGKLGGVEEGEGQKLRPCENNTQDVMGVRIRRKEENLVPVTKKKQNSECIYGGNVEGVRR